MEFFRIHKTIPFMHYRHVLNLISLVSFIVAVFWIFTHGLAFSIEFTGGTQMEVRYPSAANTEQIRQDLKAVSNEVLVQAGLHLGPGGRGGHEGHSPEDP